MVNKSFQEKFEYKEGVKQLERSILTLIFKNKVDNYRRIKLISQTMKLWESNKLKQWHQFDFEQKNILCKQFCVKRINVKVAKSKDLPITFIIIKAGIMKVDLACCKAKFVSKIC